MSSKKTVFMNGTVNKYDVEGRLAKSTELVNGEPIICEKYHPNGHLKRWYKLRGGKLHGPAYEWDENGRPMSCIVYVDDAIASVHVAPSWESTGGYGPDQ